MVIDRTAAHCPKPTRTQRAMTSLDALTGPDGQRAAAAVAHLWLALTGLGAAAATIQAAVLAWCANGGRSAVAVAIALVGMHVTAVSVGLATFAACTVAVLAGGLVQRARSAARSVQVSAAAVRTAARR